MAELMHTLGHVLLHAAKDTALVLPFWSTVQGSACLVRCAAQERRGR